MRCLIFLRVPSIVGVSGLFALDSVLRLQISEAVYCPVKVIITWKELTLPCGLKWKHLLYSEEMHLRNLEHLISDFYALININLFFWPYLRVCDVVSCRG